MPSVLSSFIGVSLSEPHIDAQFYMTYYIYIYGTTVIRALCLAASVYTMCSILHFALGQHFVQRAALFLSGLFIRARHDLAKMDASKQEAVTLEGVRGPTEPPKVLTEQRE